MNAIRLLGQQCVLFSLKDVNCHKLKDDWLVCIYSEMRLVCSACPGSEISSMVKSLFQNCSHVGYRYL
jgi:hypothetical protein